MRYYILVFLLLATGCARSLEDKVIGTYEYQGTGADGKGEDLSFNLHMIFRRNGRVETYDNNGPIKGGNNTWKVVDEEIFLTYPDGDSRICRLTPEGDLHLIAWELKGERTTPLELDEQRLWTRRRGFLRYLLIPVIPGLVVVLLGLCLWWRASRQKPSGDERI